MAQLYKMDNFGLQNKSNSIKASKILKEKLIPFVKDFNAGDGFYHFFINRKNFNIAIKLVESVIDSTKESEEWHD
jgi:hypothetical protein